VIGGVNGDHGEIFSKKISFSRRKNLYLADFAPGNPGDYSKIWRGW